jgi:solute carrier family 30 (zinc transporter), member 5/7
MYLPAYGALALHALASNALEQTTGILSSSLGITFTVSTSVLGACLFALPLYILRSILVSQILFSPTLSIQRDL